MANSRQGNDVTDLYKEAVSCLNTAALECKKTSDVNVLVMLQNCQRCGELLADISALDTDGVRLAGLQQLSCTLAYQQQVLRTKLNQLDRSRSHSSDTSSSDGSQQEQNANNSRRRAIGDTIVPKGHITLADVAGLHDAKQTLKEAIVMPVLFPHLFTGARKPWKRILLYGPPGTGKSRLAQALSSEISSTFYCVSSSDLISSWVGESEKLIKELFQHATAQEGRSVIFIDEIDSICRQRSSREEEYTRRIKNELLKQMEGADNQTQTDKVFLLCATNCPWELDSAFLRRFQKRIYIPLPDRDARLSLMRIHTKENDVEMSLADWDELADKTEGFSGSDISTVVLGALFEPIRDMQQAQYWANTSDGKLTPCDASHPGKIDARLSDLPAEQVQPADVTKQCFLNSLASNRQTVHAEELHKFQQFTVSFGQNG